MHRFDNLETITNCIAAKLDTLSINAHPTTITNDTDPDFFTPQKRKIVNVVSENGNKIRRRNDSIQVTDRPANTNMTTLRLIRISV